MCLRRVIVALAVDAESESLVERSLGRPVRWCRPLKRTVLWLLSLQTVRSSPCFALRWQIVVSLHESFISYMLVTQYTVTCVEMWVESVECFMLTACRDEVRTCEAVLKLKQSRL
jgi:hypothetical protein